MKSLNNTVFTPELGQKESGATAMKTGTTTLGIVCKDCVLMAADRRGTVGNMILGRNVTKVQPVTDHIAVTTAGSVSDLQILFKYLTAELKLKQIRNNREATANEAANLLRSWVYHLARSSYGVAHFLLGGFDTGPKLYDIFPDGSLMEHDDFIVSGSGSVFALSILDTKYKSGMTREEATELALEAMNAALTRDSASGNGIDIFIIDKNGAEHTVSKTLNTTV